MTRAQLAAELRHAEDLIAVLQKRLADPRLLAGEEPEIVQSWREELHRIERAAAALRRRQERQP